MTVVVAGCLSQPTPALPADFLVPFGDGATFTVQPAPAGQDIVAPLRTGGPPTQMVHGRAVPVFGVIDCHHVPGCRPGPAGAPGAPPRTVWLVLYPDCTDATGDSGWVVVDAVSGVGGGYISHLPCER
jgi:hypothetical protein